MANLHISILVMTCGKRKAVTKSTAMTHKHPLQHPAHKNTPPCTSACFRAQLGPRRGACSSTCTRSEPCTSPATPSECFWYPCTEQAGNLRTKYDKDIITTLTPENTQSLCFLFLAVLWTTQGSKPPLPRPCLWKHLSWERILRPPQPSRNFSTSAVYSPNSPFLSAHTEQNDKAGDSSGRNQTFHRPLSKNIQALGKNFS